MPRKSPLSLTGFRTSHIIIPFVKLKEMLQGIDQVFDKPSHSHFIRRLKDLGTSSQRVFELIRKMLWNVDRFYGQDRDQTMKRSKLIEAGWRIYASII